MDISDKAVAAATIECNTNVSRVYKLFLSTNACMYILIERVIYLLFTGNYRGSTLPKQHKRINTTNRIVFWEEESSFLSLKPKKYII